MSPSFEEFTGNLTYHASLLNTHTHTHHTTPHHITPHIQRIKLTLMKEKVACFHNNMGSFNRFGEDWLCDNKEITFTLKDPDVIDEKYNHVATTWNEFNIKVISQWHDFCLKSSQGVIESNFGKPD